MSNKRVKVIGYAKSEIYGNGIEYRNFSDDLVGNQFTSDGGSALFTLGNFKVTTNLEDRLRRSFNTGPFSNYYSLNKLKLDDDIVLLGYKDIKMMKLNLDKANLSNYAYFGSLKEFIRVSLEQIIMKWPASLYVNDTNQITGLPNTTYEDFYFDRLTNKTSFKLNWRFIKNDFEINLKKNGTILNSFNEDNKLRDIALSFSDYVLSIGGVDYPIKQFEGYECEEISPQQFICGDYISFVVEGNPFDGLGTSISYHIKPKNEKLNKFFFELDSFGSHLLNRNSTPKYKANFNYTFESENGSNILGSKMVTWPIGDGYNIDFKSTEYVEFVKNLLDIAENNDDTRSNILTNRLVSKSILEFDTVDSKMDKTLKIYGRNMDEIKTYIDSIKFINHISYNKKNNIPDRLVKNLARTMGWELTTSLFNIDFNDDFLSSKGSLNLSPVESEIEFWRRLILNSPWIWKSKGTRKVIEFLLHFVGTPKGLVSFNEFVYKASNSLDVDEVEQIYLSLGLDYNTKNTVIDNDGFPRVPRNNQNMYFQKGGQWYRQTSGENSNLDLNKGNNPHEGPYDFGYAFINQFNNVVPNFEPVILSSTKVSTSNEQIFLNYDNGKFDKFLTAGQEVNEVINSYIQILTTSNVAIDGTLIQVTDQIVKSPKPKSESEHDAYEVGSYKISVSRKSPEYSNPCDYTSFSLDSNGLVLFTHVDGSQNYNMTSECCSGLSFTPELNDNNQFVCRWKPIIVDPCEKYVITDNTNTSGYAVFINNETGGLTDLVPTTECCSNEGLAYVNEGDMFHCLKGVLIEEPTCEDYVFTGDYSGEYAVFQYGGTNTTTVLSAECCTVNGFKVETVNGEIKCVEDVVNCESYIIHEKLQDGTIRFKDVDGFITDTVPSVECCEYHGFIGTTVGDGIKCFEVKEDISEPEITLIDRVIDGDSSTITVGITGVPNTIVKYRVTVINAADQGFTNTLIDLETGKNITPASPTPFSGSYCEGSIAIGSSGVVEVEMVTKSKEPLNNLTNNCSKLEFGIIDYDYVTINGNNKIVNEACYPI